MTDESSGRFARRSAYMEPQQELLAQVERLQVQLDELRKAVVVSEIPVEGVAASQRAVQGVLRSRRSREAIFGEGLFADPAWDILLEAYAARLGQRRTSVSDLCTAAAVPSTTALRWLLKLEEDGWLERLPDPLDARRSWVELTSKGTTAMERVAAECVLGLPI
jgi:predicted Rossmann fold nucleotide-binding protein DprA/Smf involved in DNA uptake